MKYQVVFCSLKSNKIRKCHLLQGDILRIYLNSLSTSVSASNLCTCSLDIDQTQQNIGPDLDSNDLIL